MTLMGIIHHSIPNHAVSTFLFTFPRQIQLFPILMGLPYAILSATAIALPNQMLHVRVNLFFPW